MSWRPCLPGLEGTRPVGSLGSSGITRLPRYSGPLRHRLAFDRFPGGAGYTAYLAPPLSRRDEDGFSSCSTRPGHRAVAPTPPECPVASASLRRVMRPSPSGCGLGLRGFSFSGPPLRSLALRPGDSLTIPRMALSMGFGAWFPAPRPSKLRGVWLLPRWDCLPLNTPAFAGHAGPQELCPPLDRLCRNEPRGGPIRGAGRGVARTPSALRVPLALPAVVGVVVPIRAVPPARWLRVMGNRTAGRHAGTFRTIERANSLGRLFTRAAFGISRRITRTAAPYCGQRRYWNTQSASL